MLWGWEAASKCTYKLTLALFKTIFTDHPKVFRTEESFLKNTDFFSQKSESGEKMPGFPLPPTGAHASSTYKSDKSESC